jgi:antitoxin component of MazEF toxin-antitoxin module
MGVGPPAAKACFVAEQVEFREGTAVEFIVADGMLTLRAKRRGKYTLSQLLARAKSPSPYRDLDRIKPVGRELL